MRILLVRHGESEANVDKKILRTRPDHDIGLSPLGIEQAKVCGTYLNLVIEGLKDRAGHGEGYNNDSWRIWHSPYNRAVQTAEIIRDRVKVRDMHSHFLLGEQQFGLFDGMTNDERRETYPAEQSFYEKHKEAEGIFWSRMPLGESCFDVAKRIHQSFETFHRDSDRHGVENLIIVCHGVVIRAFVMAWCCKSIDWMGKEPNSENCAIRLISGGKDKGYLNYPIPLGDRVPVNVGRWDLTDRERALWPKKDILR